MGEALRDETAAKETSREDRCVTTPIKLRRRLLDLVKLGIISKFGMIKIEWWDLHFASQSVQYFDKISEKGLLLIKISAKTELSCDTKLTNENDSQKPANYANELNGNLRSVLNEFIQAYFVVIVYSKIPFLIVALIL